MSNPDTTACQRPFLPRLPASLIPHSPSCQQGGDGDDSDTAAAAKLLCSEIRLLRARRVLRTLGLVQDLADLLIVLPEVRPSKKGGLLSHGAFIALAGLVSGCLSAYKNWQAVSSKGGS